MRSSQSDVFCEKGVLKKFIKFTVKHLCQSLSFNKVFYKKETLAQVFSCEYCKIFNNTYFIKTPLVAASVSWISFFAIFMLLHFHFWETWKIMYTDPYENDRNFSRHVAAIQLYFSVLNKRSTSPKFRLPTLQHFF